MGTGWKGLCCLILLWVGGAFPCLAHEPAITGTVLDHQSGLPVPGATVVLENTLRGTTTNQAGQFWFYHLEAGEYRLQISYLGFESQVHLVQVEKGSSAQLTTVLKSGAIQLKEATVPARTHLTTQSMGRLALQLRPLASAQEALQVVPGLFVAQHAGGGKAEQLFLRGFDLDHGTDVALEVDGMPVNMVSHAHGQGYSDLHFVIPELIRSVEAGKGPHDVRFGNFATAGNIGIQTRDVLDRNVVKLEAGRFDTYRIMAGANLPGFIAKAPNQSGFVATEYRFSNGPFESPQGFERLNLMGKYRHSFQGNTILSTSVSLFESSWKASGQIPERAVRSGSISRFGAIDDTEGGRTGKASVNLQLLQLLGHEHSLKNQLYYARYWFSLYSNFTFWLNDPVNGDQIHQRETRDQLGYKGEWRFKKALKEGNSWVSTAGWGLRFDRVSDNELSHTLNRKKVLNYHALGDVNEVNTYGFLAEELVLGNYWTVKTALRFDRFDFAYRNRIEEQEDQQQASQSQLSPKFSLGFKPTTSLALFLKVGSGFHSNDARVSVVNRNTLPRAWGVDLGSDWKPRPNLLIHAAVWGLDLEDELVYVGDEAIVESNGASRRVGADFSVRYQFAKSWFVDTDVNYAYARSLSGEASARRIPLAPEWTSSGGLTWKTDQGFNASLRYRFLGDRAANEDNSLTAEGYALLDAVLGFARPKYAVGLTLVNLLNSAWKETQFETESRLKEESEAVSEIHFTPGTPFSAQLSFSFFF